MNVRIFRGVIVTDTTAFQDRIWHEFVFSNSNGKYGRRGCFWMILENKDEHILGTDIRLRLHEDAYWMVLE